MDKSLMDRPILKAKSRIKSKCSKAVRKTEEEAKSILKRANAVTLKSKEPKASHGQSKSASDDMTVQTVHNVQSTSKNLSNFRIPKLKPEEKGKLKMSEEKRGTDSSPLPIFTTRSRSRSNSSSQEDKNNKTKSELISNPKEITQKHPLKRSPLKPEPESTKELNNDNKRGKTLKSKLVEISENVKTNDVRLPKVFNIQRNQKVEDSLPKTSVSGGLPIPDYEDVIEDMEWETQVPEIRRLWQENEITATLSPEISKVSNTDDDMEVDPSELLIIVPDTNIWIGCVDLLKQLLETYFPKVGYPTVVIPWMVLQELDVNSKATGFKPVRNSVKFIHELLSSRHPRVKGQKASEAALSQLKFDELTADDSILQCAFQLQRNDTTVVFLSNDRNLCNKALVHGLFTFDSHAAVSKIFAIFAEDKQNPPSLHNNSFNSIATTNSPSPMPATYYKGRNDGCITNNTNRTDNFGVDKVYYQSYSNGIGKYPLEKKSSDMTNATKVSRLSTTTLVNENKRFSEILTALQTAISFIIEIKMNEDYGETWLDTVKIKPPWTLLSSIKCLIEHWIAVFSFVFSPRGKSNAEQLFRVIKEYEYSSGPKGEQEGEIVEAALALFNMGKESVMKDSKVENCRQILLNFTLSNKK